MMGVSIFETPLGILLLFDAHRVVLLQVGHIRNKAKDPYPKMTCLPSLALIRLVGTQLPLDGGLVGVR